MSHAEKGKVVAAVKQTTNTMHENNNTKKENGSLGEQLLNTTL